jgi:hypothetical protein
METKSSYIKERVPLPPPILSAVANMVDSIAKDYSGEDVETSESCFYSYFLWCQNTGWHTDPVDQFGGGDLSEYFKTQLIVLKASPSHLFKDFEGNSIPLTEGDVLVFDATKEHCLKGKGLFLCLAQDLFDRDDLFDGEDWLSFLPDCL